MAEKHEIEPLPGPDVALGAGKRLQVELDAEDMMRLSEAKKLAGEKTNTDAIRRALRFYRWALAKDDEGFTLQMVRDGKVVEVALL
jgi:hypothetical protein